MNLPSSHTCYMDPGDVQECLGLPMVGCGGTPTWVIEGAGDRECAHVCHTCLADAMQWIWENSAYSHPLVVYLIAS